MIKRTLTFVVLLAACNAFAQITSIQATIDGGRTGAPISKRIYGQFIEHIAGIINTGIWAEMLEDRKFYYPITSQVPPVPTQRWRGPVQRWTPVGPDEFIIMDTQYAFTGDHSPLVKLSPSAARGFQQTGLVVHKGRHYTGRIVLAGDPEARVSVELIGGDQEKERRSISVGKLRTAYAISKKIVSLLLDGQILSFINPHFK